MTTLASSFLMTSVIILLKTRHSLLATIMVHILCRTVQRNIPTSAHSMFTVFSSRCRGNQSFGKGRKDANGLTMHSGEGRKTVPAKNLLPNGTTEALMWFCLAQSLHVGCETMHAHVKSLHHLLFLAKYKVNVICNRKFIKPFLSHNYD